MNEMLIVYFQTKYWKPNKENIKHVDPKTEPITSFPHQARLKNVLFMGTKKYLKMRVSNSTPRKFCGKQARNKKNSDCFLTQMHLRRIAVFVISKKLPSKGIKMKKKIP